MPKVYALLVGINAYAPEVGRLSGCLNDVDHFHAHLKETVPAADLAVEVLKDGQATRNAVIEQFRDHLGQARAGDVAVFQYCGHGARWASAPQFKEFFADGKDEGLVCFDSRSPGGYDLADKELAVLIDGVARNDPHLAVILDCCHSGSGTRGADAIRGLRPRLTHEVTTVRPLESYIDGHYAKQLARGAKISIPGGRHVLLAACERHQLAQESPDQSGVFTSTLVEVLAQTGGLLTYADLFVRCRAAVRRRAENQDPQFETAGHFDAHAGFLGRAARKGGRFYSIGFTNGKWSVDCGAIQGMPTDATKPVSLALYALDDPTRQVGTAETLLIGAQSSEVTLGFAGDESARYRAEVTSLPAAALSVHCPVAVPAVDALQAALEGDASVQVALSQDAAGARYALRIEDDTLMLVEREFDRPIRRVALANTKPETAAGDMVQALRAVAQWERGLALQNRKTRLDPTWVEWKFDERLADGTECSHTGEAIVLDIVRTAGQWTTIRGRFRVRHRAPLPRGTPLHILLLYFSSNHGIYALRNEPVEPGEDWTTLWGDSEDDFLEISGDQMSERFVLQLIVSTEKVDEHLLVQDGIKVDRTRGMGGVNADAKLTYVNEWFTLTRRIDLVRQLDDVDAAKDTSLAGGKIVVKAHPSLKAHLSLSGTGGASRGVGGDSDFHKAFLQPGVEMLNFAGTRGGDASVLELSGIDNADSLQANPLEIELKLGLKPGRPSTPESPGERGEAVLPVVFDGEFAMIAGDSETGDDGTARIRITQIPPCPSQRRSLGGSLKLYFFKTYLKNDDVNRLRWIEYRKDGSFSYRTDDIPAKVNAARNVLLLVHGIIGDTEGMVAGVRACGLVDDGTEGTNRPFDLVLTFDYENLSTAIEKTAQDLKRRLDLAGLRAGDDKRLTLLVHSMGGLVSRWFIEREGGHQVVDHLVMCGTPNHGSPFGRIEDARRIAAALTGLSMNLAPALIPFSSTVLMVLNRSKKVTPALEQMNPDSPFIQTLNASPDPGIPYTILAGDVSRYDASADPFFARLTDKIGTSALVRALFAEQPNDIAVGMNSILTVGAARAAAPVRQEVACHHLNYFSSDNGQQALRAVAWSRA